MYRPAAVTAWPKTYGPQTARVVGPEGQSIWTDKYGRVKVKFHWDRLAKGDDTSSCWVRVSSAWAGQGFGGVKVKFHWDRLAKGDDTSSCWVRVSSAWAGQGFGGVQIPRVGDEVVIDFINGDPDRPIITGRVYNEASMPPWALPDDATRMGFMTRSKDGNKDNASYLFFEDRLGSESVDLHSERDMNVSVEGIHNEVVHKATIYHHKTTRSVTVDDLDMQTFKQGQILAVTAKGREERIVDNEKKSVTGFSDNTYTSNLVIKTDDSVSTLAAHKIMYEAPEVVFGQLIDAQGNASKVEPIPFDIKQTKGQVISAEGSHPTAADYLASASSSSIGVATKVTYKKGVITDIQGVNMRTVHQNQITDVKGNVAISIKGNLNETVLGDVSIYSPGTISIKSDTNVDIDAPFWVSNAKGVSTSFTGLSLAFTGVSGGLTGMSIAHNVVDSSTKNIDLSDADVRARLKNKVDISKSNLRTFFNNLFIVG
ncbi:type VI secretion system tip protein TssI/VgrG [Kosakonia sp. H02]|nr:type VI secretion system tip protein TssI/VgrG [Kosakonia sp. H02]